MKERILAVLIVGVTILGVYTLIAQSRVTTPRIAATVVSPEMSTSNDLGMMQLAQVETGTSSEKGSAVQTAVPKEPVSRPEMVVEWGADPFVRDWVLVSEVANLNLRAITVSPTGASALINDQILQVGDEIRGKKVVSIEQDRVTLEQGGRTFTLTLGE